MNTPTTHLPGSITALTPLPAGAYTATLDDDTEAPVVALAATVDLVAEDGATLTRAVPVFLWSGHPYTPAELEACGGPRCTGVRPASA